MSSCFVSSLGVTRYSEDVIDLCHVAANLIVQSAENVLALAFDGFD